MLERILVPLDGSRRAERALRWARRLIEKPRGTLILLHAVPPSIPFGGPPEETVREELRRARRYLKMTAASLLRGACRTEIRAEEDEPSRLITRTATRERAELIVMSGRGGVEGSGWPLGSVARRVIHRARTPLLLVRGSASAARRILVPLDGTNHWKPLMTHVGEVAAATRSKITLVNLGARNGPVPGRAMDVLTRRGIPGRQLHRTGRKDRSILETARETGADLIALACPNDLGGAKSPTESVLRKTDGSVLLVPVPAARAMAAGV